MRSTAEPFGKKFRTSWTVSLLNPGHCLVTAAVRSAVVFRSDRVNKRPSCAFQPPIIDTLANLPLWSSLEGTSGMKEPSLHRLNEFARSKERTLLDSYL